MVVSFFQRSLYIMTAASLLVSATSAYALPTEKPPGAAMLSSDERLNQIIQTPLGDRFSIGKQALTLPDVDSRQLPENYNLPRLGPTDITYKGMNEFRVGRAFMRVFRAETAIWDDPITQNYLESLWATLLPHARLPHRITPAILMISTPDFNAFAAPGGVFGLNTGVFISAPDRDAFASVLAHEIGHIAHRHFAHSLESSESKMLPVLSGILAGMAMVVAGAAEEGAATVTAVNAASYQSQLDNSRGHERQADNTGLEILARAGMDPQAMPRMFKQMSRSSDSDIDVAPEFLSTHPLTRSRINAAQARANQLKSPPARIDVTYELIRVRATLGIYGNNYNKVQGILAGELKSTAAKDYLQALQLAQQKRTDEALARLDQLAAQYPAQLVIAVSAIDIALDDYRYDDALQRTHELRAMDPDYYPLKVMEGRALLHKDAQASMNIFRELVRQRAEDPQMWALLAESAGRAGKTSWMHLAMAQRLQLNGDMDNALKQMDYAHTSARQAEDYYMLGLLRSYRDDLKQDQSDLKKL